MTFARVRDVAVLAVKPCVRLVSLPSTDIATRNYAIYALSRIIEWPEGAQAAVDANALQLVPELLDSSDALTRELASKMLGKLALHRSTAPAVLGLKPCEWITSFLSDENMDIRKDALCILAMISRWPAGAHAAMEARGLDFVPELLDSSDTETRRWACYMLGYLTKFEPTAVPSLVKPGPSGRLMQLLNDPNIGVVEATVFVLAKIAQTPGGARTVHASGECLLELLYSPNPNTRRRTCYLL
ncbi:armadillo-type protein [Mycena leptocephala]|nr:armadillo-type protein [Mycena leptocephala]